MVTVSGVLVHLSAEGVDRCCVGSQPSGEMQKLASVIGKNTQHIALSCLRQVLILSMTIAPRRSEAVTQAVQTEHARGVLPARRYD